MWGLPRQPPSSLPHCRSPWEPRGRGEAPHMHTGAGMDCVLLGLWCTLCTPSQHCRKGMVRAQRMGQRGDSTHNCRHVVLCLLSAAGHWQREGGISMDPNGLHGLPYAPFPDILHRWGQKWVSRGHPQPTSAPSPTACISACPRNLSSLEKHQGCLQKQLKNLCIDHLISSHVFLTLPFLFGLGASQPALTQVVSDHLHIGRGEHPTLARQPAHPFISATKINSITKINTNLQSISQTLKSHCSTRLDCKPLSIFPTQSG